MSAASVGAAELARERRGTLPPRLSILVAAVSVLLVPAACADGRAPTALVDGSTARAPDVSLEGVPGPVIRTKTKLVPAPRASASPLAGRCLRALRAGSRPSGPVVERIGVLGGSVTLTVASGLAGCDATTVPAGRGRAWCGRPFGLLRHGRLEDPRLGLGCRTRGGTLVAFAWISPGRGTGWVTVRQKGYVEAYRTVGRVPVRIASAGGVSIETARATFRVTEHDARGSLLREYELHAAVAG